MFCSNSETEREVVRVKLVYYIFIAILMLFLVISEDDKSGNFLRGDKSFRTLKRTMSHRSRTNDVTSMYHLRHFGTSQKVKTDIF